MTAFWIRAALVTWVCVALVATCGAQSPRRQERVWTDRQGRQRIGRFERVSGDNIYLNIDGQVTAVPLSQLSDDDRNFLQGKPAPAPPPATNTPTTPVAPRPAADARVWQIGNKQVIGGLSAADDAGFTLETAGGPVRVGFEMIADDADAREVIAQLTALRRGDLIASVETAYKRNTGKSLADADRPTASPTDDEPPETIGETANVVLGVAPNPVDSHEFPKYRTADQFLAESAATVDPQQEAKFRSTAMWGGLTMVGVIAAVLAYGWFTMRRS